jgi:hypothetical protein
MNFFAPYALQSNILTKYALYFNALHMSSRLQMKVPYSASGLRFARRFADALPAFRIKEQITACR